MSLPWAGNVRELENVVERAVVLCTGSLIDEMDIPSPEAQSADAFFSNTSQDFPTITQLEERYIKLVLDRTGGRKDKAAQILGMNRRTLYRKEREYGLISQDLTEAEDLATESEYRTSLDLSQSDLACKLKVSRATVLA
jgi:DNA-binding NtrC family response regulator